MFKTSIKNLMPASLISFYHKTLSFLGAWLYGFPSEKLIIIGVTGTNGKSSVVNLIGLILEEAGKKVGWTSTINFQLGNKNWLNDKKMTMLGRLATHKFLKQALRAGCQYAVIETSSEGIKQFRHLTINYDIVVFTNLTPEHIESHGSFANYKKAKGELFKHLTSKPKKIINGQAINKIIVVNGDDPNADYFLTFEADQKITYSIDQPANFKAENVRLYENGSAFELDHSDFKTKLIGKVNVYNALAAMVVAKTQDLGEGIIQQALLKQSSLPGRFEFIDEGQNFKMMVDYAPEPESLKHLYETLKLFSYNRLIHVLGSCGGGRDVSRRPILGKMAGETADLVIVTNEDPYDDDPKMIIDQVSEGALMAGKILGKNIFKIEDRKEAIKFALSQAQENDLILLTGKGSEQFICAANGQKIPWDDREVARKELKNFRRG